MHRLSQDRCRHEHTFGNSNALMPSSSAAESALVSRTARRVRTLLAPLLPHRSAGARAATSDAGLRTPFVPPERELSPLQRHFTRLAEYHVWATAELFKHIAVRVR